MIDSVNFIDLLALLIIGIAVYLGWRSGFVIQALALAGFVVGVVIVVLAAPAAAKALLGPRSVPAQHDRHLRHRRDRARGSGPGKRRRRISSGGA